MFSLKVELWQFVSATEKTAEQQQAERDRLCRQFLDVSSQLKTKSLAVVQSCSDLPRRAAVRSTLDQVAKLTAQIIAAMGNTSKGLLFILIRLIFDDRLK